MGRRSHQPEDAYIERTPREKVIDQLVEDLKWAVSVCLKKGIQAINWEDSTVGALWPYWHVLPYKTKDGNWLQNSEYIIENSPYGLYEYEKLFHHEGDVENDPKNIEAIVYSLLYLKSVHKVCPMKLAVRQTISPQSNEVVSGCLSVYRR